MLVTINTKNKVFKNNIESINPLIIWIEEIVKDSKLHFSHMIIDGEEVFEQFDLVLSEKVTEIEEIKVVLKTEMELLNEIYLSGESYLTRALPEVNKLAESFYQGAGQDEWKTLELFIEGVSWLDQLFNMIDQLTKKPTNWDDFVVAFTKIRMELINLEDAIKANDQSLIADIINYECMPKMEELKLAFTACIDQEGERKDVN